MKNFLDKIKEFATSTWSLIAVSVGAVLLTLLHLLRKKQDENNALRAKDKLNEADKQSALLDQQVAQKQTENAQLQDERATTGQELDKLEQKRKESLKKEKARPDDEVEEYWKNN
jgi:septal ring factor EnvC (AmiA/AmiB activator)